MAILHSKNFKFIWGVWILVLGVSLFFIHTIQYVHSFSEYFRAFIILDLPSSWCPTFLTLYGAATLLANFLTSSRFKKAFTIISKFAGLVLLPVGIYATYTFTLEESFSFNLIYIYAQTIHISEVLTGLLTIFILATNSDKKKIIFISLIATIILLSGCKQDSEKNLIKKPEQGSLVQTQDVKKYDLDVIYKDDNTPEPDWIKEFPNQDGPWYDDVYMASSEDGLNFSNEKLFVDHAGVANLLLTSDNKLIASFQYFSYEHEEMFDVIAYAVSEDFGKTWSKLNKIVVQEQSDLGKHVPHPVDPTLVELEDSSFRLYYTFHYPGEEYPEFCSASSKTLDTPFQSEGPQLKTEEIILDPAVIYFNNTWHHYTVKPEQQMSDTATNIHSTSKDGQNFKLEDDIVMDFRFLGQVIEDNGELRFYNGSESATSKDGYTWTKDSGQRVDGADPGVVKLPDGSYLMIYTKLNPINKNFTQF